MGRALGYARAVGPPESESAEASARLRELLTRHALAVERYRATVARQLGLSDLEMSAIAYLAQASELTPGQLRARLLLSSGGTSALIQRLVRSGHVERSPHPTDGRSAVVRLTEPMRTSVRRLAAPLHEAIEGAVVALSSAEREMVHASLDRIVAATEVKAAAFDGESPDDVAGLREDVSNAWF